MRTGRVALVLGALAACAPPPAADAPVERITVPRGATFAAITDTLVARGLVESPRWFRFVARIRGLDRQARSGIYDIPHGARAMDILAVLRTGRSVAERFTVPEGLTLAEVAALAEDRLSIPADSLLAAAHDPALLAEFGVDAPSFEGFLRPETYFIPLTAGGRDLVREMAAAFRDHWDPVWDARAAELGLDRTGFVTLASIVEGEARLAGERPLVAAVYLNRLRIGMPLQADPTVQYAIQRATGERKPRLLLKDYEFESPYNTYLIPGLPPGPVGLPGRSALDAVAHPADVPYLFFVADDTGGHVFSRTYAEHLRAIQRIRGGR
jgi:UPF0755 protein